MSTESSEDRGFDESQDVGRLSDEELAETYGLTVDQFREAARLVNEVPMTQWDPTLLAVFQADPPGSLEGVAEVVMSWIKNRDAE